jgi:hypothetical protein
MNQHPFRITVTIEHQLPDIAATCQPLRYTVSADCASEDLNELRDTCDAAVIAVLTAAGFAVECDDDEPEEPAGDPA